MLDSTLENKKWHVKEKKLKEGFKGHLFAVLGLDFTSDGKWMVSSSFDGTARLWNYRTKTQEGVFFFLSEAIEEVSISPDGRFIAAITSESSKAYVHDRKTGETFPISPERVLRGVSAWNNQSNLVALLDYDDNLIVVDPVSKEEIFHIRIGEPGGRSLSWQPSEFIAIGLRNGVIKLVDIHKKEVIMELDNETFNGHLGQVNSLCFLTSKMLASCADDERVIVWNVNTGAISSEFKGKLGAISLHGKEDVIAVGYENTIQVFFTSNEEKRIEIKHGTTGSVIRVDPIKMVLARGLRENEVVFWSIEDGEEVFAFKGHKRTIEVAALDAEKMLLITGSIDRLVNVHDLNKKDTLIHQLAGHSEAISSVFINPKSNIAISGSYDDTLRFWNYIDGSSQGLITGLPLVSSMTLIPNTNLTVVACSGDFSIRTYDFTSLVATISDVHEDFINSVVALSDGTILSGSDDGTIKAITTNPPSTRTILEIDSPITSLTLSPDETLLAVGTESGTVSIVRLQDQNVFKQQTFNNAIKTIAFTPDGKTLLIAHQTTLCGWKLDDDLVFNITTTTEPITAIFPLEAEEDHIEMITCSHNEDIILVELTLGPPHEEDTITAKEAISEVPEEVEPPTVDEWEQQTINSILTHLENNLNKIKDLLTLAQEDFSAQIFESGVLLTTDHLKTMATLFLPILNELDTMLSMAIQYTNMPLMESEEGPKILSDEEEIKNASEEITKMKKKISDVVNWGSRWQQFSSDK